MNNKGSAYIMLFISLVLGILLVTNFTIPVIRQSDSLSEGSETLVYVNTSVDQNFTLSETPESLSIAGLTLTSDYTTSGDLVTILAGTAVDNYTATYTYEGVSYIEDSSSRTLWTMLGLAFILGLVFFLFKGFGVV